MMRRIGAAQLEAVSPLLSLGKNDRTVLWSSAFVKGDQALTSEYKAWRNEESDRLLRYFDGK
jgi:hypothetical protein